MPISSSVYSAITNAVYGAYHPSGSKTIAELTSDLLVLANIGNVYKITGKEYPGLIDMCKELSFYDKFNPKYLERTTLDYNSQTLKFFKKDETSQTVVYFRQMHEEKYGKKDDLMKIVKYLRKIVREEDDKLEKYGKHPNLKKVQDTVLGWIEMYTKDWEKRFERPFKIESTDYQYRGANTLGNSHMYGDGYSIRITTKIKISGSICDTPVGILSFWEDTLGCLHFAYTRGRVWDGDIMEYVEWKDAEYRVKSFIHKVEYGIRNEFR